MTGFEPGTYRVPTLRHNRLAMLKGVLVGLAIYEYTSHLSVRLSAMRVIVNDVSSHLCKILTLLNNGQNISADRKEDETYRIARRPVVICKGYFSHNDF